MDKKIKHQSLTQQYFDQSLEKFAKGLNKNWGERFEKLTQMVQRGFQETATKKYGSKFFFTKGF